MRIRRPVAQVVDPDIQQAGIFSPFENTVRERPLEKIEEDRQDMKDHVGFRSFNPSGSSTVIRRAAGLISTQIERANGIIKPLPTTSNPEPPASSNLFTRP